MPLVSTTLALVAGYNSAGEPVYEEVHVEQQGPSRYRLLQSPGLTPGLAAGDIFVLEENGFFKVVERAGNVCIQLLIESGWDELEQFATPEFKRIGAYLDGRSEQLLVYTVSVDVGFQTIERVISNIKRKFPDIEWYYGNVYDSADGVTLLNWWLKPE